MSDASGSESSLEGVEEDLLNLQAALGLYYRKVRSPPPSPSVLSSCA